MVIQMKDLLSDSTVNTAGLTKISSNSVKSINTVKKGDVFFRSRGQLMKSAILTKDIVSTITSAPLIRIRAKESQVLPEYINWFISQKPAQEYFTQRAKGTTISMISKSTLENLDIYLPIIATQRKIIELAALSEREQTITQSIASKRKSYISTTLLALAAGELK